MLFAQAALQQLPYTHPHTPAPPLPPHLQDKRSVIPIERGDLDLWLAGTVEQAKALLKLTPPQDFDAGPEGAPKP